MKDSFGRNINYLRVSLTDRCNLRCKYCMPKEGCELYDMEDILTLEEVFEVVKASVELGVDKVRFTGGEPLVRLGLVDLIEKVGSLEGIRDISLTTNAITLKDMAFDLKKAGLNRVNISLDTLDSNKYRDITRGGDLSKALEGINAAREVGLTPIKINSVIINGFNDDEIADLIDLTSEGIDIRFIELMPIGEAADFAEDKFISGEEIRSRVEGLKPVLSEDISSPAKYYRLGNNKGKVGFINALSCKFCENCNRIRLTSDGKLKTCLHSDREIDLMEPLRLGQDIRPILIGAIAGKEESHHLEEKDYIVRNMSKIGG